MFYIICRQFHLYHSLNLLMTIPLRSIVLFLTCFAPLITYSLLSKKLMNSMSGYHVPYSSASEFTLSSKRSHVSLRDSIICVGYYIAPTSHLYDIATEY